jgi:uncharacterized membrane protein YkoI
MLAVERLAIAALLALVIACPRAHAQNVAQATAQVTAQVTAQAAAPVVAPAQTETGDVCLDQKQRRAASESGGLIRLSAAMRAAKAQMPGTVVRARLCQGQDGLVYVLTVLARDGKVARIAVDAVKGTLVGGL